MLGGVGYAGLARYFKNKEDERIDQLRRRHRRRMERKARRAGVGQRRLDARLDDVEADLGRTVLLAMTVDRLLVRKGILTSAEMADLARQLDVLDGVADGKLDPATVRPEAAATTEDPDGPEEFLRRLEREG